MSVDSATTRPQALGDTEIKEGGVTSKATSFGIDALEAARDKLQQNHTIIQQTESEARQASVQEVDAWREAPCSSERDDVLMDR
jgi:hypothetical protein